MAKNRKFKEDHNFYTFMLKVFDVIILNFLFLLCCIPVITIGVSATALYSMMMKMVRNEEPGVAKGFFKAFKENCKQSLPMTLLMLLIIVLVLADLQIFAKSDASYAGIMYSGGLAILLAVVAVAGYAFPLLAKFENTVKNTIMNAAKIAVAYLPWTIVILLVNIAPVVILLLNPQFFVRISTLWLCVGAGVSAYLNSMILVRIFDKFIEE